MPDPWLRDVCPHGGRIITNRPLVIDVGAAVKGHLVDLIAGVLGKVGINDFVVDGSSDLRHAGPEPVVVGLERPIS